MKSAIKRVAGLGFLLFAGSAAAQSSYSCENIVSWYSSNPVSNASLPTNHPECFGGSSTSSTTSINATAFTQAGAITQALSARSASASKGPVASLSGQTGMAAGEVGKSWNVWAGHSANTSSVRLNNGNNRSDTDVGTTILGGDFALSSIMTAGISAAFDRGDTSSLAGGKSTNQGYSIAPYLGYQLSKELSLDVSAGLGKGKFSTAAARADADRWFATANLSYSKWTGNFQYTGRATYLHGEEKYDNLTGTTNTAATNKLDQVRLGARAAYWMNGVMPYAGLAYTADVRRSSSLPVAIDPLGRAAFVLSLGADFFSLSSKITGGISYEQEHGRTNSKNETILANINVRF